MQKSDLFRSAFEERVLVLDIEEDDPKDGHEIKGSRFHRKDSVFGQVIEH